jgi:hypothetical protein
MDMKTKYFYILVGNCGKRPLRRLRHRWEGNIEMELREECWRNIQLKCTGSSDKLIMMNL